MPATVEKRGIGTMVSPWPPSTKALTSSTLTLHFVGQEVAETGAVQHPGHADDLFRLDAGEFLQRPDHGIERIGDADDERIRRILLDAFADRGHHFQIDADQIVAAHARLARHAGGDDHHIGALDVGIVLGALEFGIKAFDGTGLGQIQRFALGQTFGNVEDHDIAQFLDRRQMSQRAADLSATDKGNFLARHGKGPLSVRVKIWQLPSRDGVPEQGTERRAFR